MKQSIRIITLSLLSAVILTGCSTWRKLNNTEQGAIIGAGTGAAIGGVASGGAGGALLGGAAGGVAGGVIGNNVDDD